ncbi:MAG: hypothetical protein LC650_02250 [Actinobacteria bacterium]|nr:hypothetical protein [Actinomycetota bacterium]
MKTQVYADQVRARAERTVSGIVEDMYDEGMSERAISEEIRNHYMDIAGELGVPREDRAEVVEAAMRC